LEARKAELNDQLATTVPDQPSTVLVSSPLTSAGHRFEMKKVSHDADPVPGTITINPDGTVESHPRPWAGVEHEPADVEDLRELLHTSIDRVVVSPRGSRKPKELDPGRVQVTWRSAPRR
jgi:hypothetical protein